jgi:exodeoxyribonuclease VII small subunit
MTTDEQSSTGASGAATGGSPAPGGDRTFEELMEELETITERLAAGDLGIEAAADLYERAEKLHAQAAERLAAVRSKVEKLAAPAP